MRATINNTFHNTSKSINLKPGKNIISSARLKTWKRSLCCDGCKCSGSDGTRGDDNTPSVECKGKACETSLEYDCFGNQDCFVVWVE